MDKILIFTDDGAGDSLLRTILQDEGLLLFLPSCAREGSLRHLRTLEADAVIIDADGGRRAAELCSRLHACIGVKPTIVLGNSSEETDKVMALEAGADDYVVKPFAARELIARLNAVLRRRRSNRSSRAGFDDIEVNHVTRTVRRDGKKIEMTRCEYRLLSFFLSNVDLALKREMLLGTVWGYVDGSRSRTLDTYVRRLRLKCEQDPENPRRILTIHGIGYRFRGPLIAGEGGSADTKNRQPNIADAGPSQVMNATQSPGSSIAAAE